MASRWASRCKEVSICYTQTYGRISCRKLTAVEGSPRYKNFRRQVFRSMLTLSPNARCRQPTDRIALWPVDTHFCAGSCLILSPSRLVSNSVKSRVNQGKPRALVLIWRSQDPKFNALGVHQSLRIHHVARIHEFQRLTESYPKTWEQSRKLLKFLPTYFTDGCGARRRIHFRH